MIITQKNLLKKISKFGLIQNYIQLNKVHKVYQIANIIITENIYKFIFSSF
jgi:hypothetical protein